MTIHYAGRTGKARAIVEDIEAEGGQAITVQGDVGNPADVERLFTSTQDAFGRIDVVVNSAAIMSMASISVDNLDAFDCMHW